MKNAFQNIARTALFPLLLLFSFTNLLRVIGSWVIDPYLDVLILGFCVFAVCMIVRQPGVGSPTPQSHVPSVVVVLIGLVLVSLTMVSQWKYHLSIGWTIVLGVGFGISFLVVHALATRIGIADSTVDRE